MSGRNWRDDFNNRPRRRSRSRSPCRGSYGDDTSAYSDRKRSISYGNERDRSLNSGNLPAGLNRASTYRPGGGDSSNAPNTPSRSPVQNHDPRIPHRIDTTNVPSHSYTGDRSGTASALTAGTKGNLGRSSGGGSASGPREIHSREGQQDPAVLQKPITAPPGATMDPRRPTIPPAQPDALTDLFTQAFDEATFRAQLLQEKEKLQKVADRRAKELTKLDGVASNFPAAAEAQDEARVKSKQAINRIETRLKQYDTSRDKTLREFSRIIRSFIVPPPAASAPPESVAPAVTKKIEADLLELSKNVQKLNDKISVLQQDSFDGKEQDGLLVEKITQLQSQLAQNKGEMISLQSKTDKVLVVRDLGPINERLDQLTISMEATTKNVESIRGDMYKGLEEEKSARESKYEQVMEKTEQRMDKLRTGLDEVNSDVRNVEKNSNDQIARLSRELAAAAISQPQRPGVETEKRLQTLEATALTTTKKIDDSIALAGQKEDMLGTALDEMTARVEAVGKNFQKMQADILESTSRINKAHSRLDRIVPTAAPPNSTRSGSTSVHGSPSLPPTPEPAAPVQSGSNPSLQGVQNLFKSLQNHVNTIQQQLINYQQTSSAQTHALQVLEGRYNNITSEPLVRSMVQRLQEMYPFAANAQVEIEHLKGAVAALQRPPDQQTQSPTKPDDLQELRSVKDALAAVEQQVRDAKANFEKVTAEKTAAEKDAAERPHVQNEKENQSMESFQWMEEILDKKVAELSELVMSAIGRLEARVEKLEESDDKLVAYLKVNGAAATSTEGSRNTTSQRRSNSSSPNQTRETAHTTTSAGTTGPGDRGLPSKSTTATDEMDQQADDSDYDMPPVQVGSDLPGSGSGNGNNDGTGGGENAPPNGSHTTRTRSPRSQLQSQFRQSGRNTSAERAGGAGEGRSRRMTSASPTATSNYKTPQIAQRYLKRKKKRRIMELED